MVEWGGHAVGYLVSIAVHFNVLGREANEILWMSFLSGYRLIIRR
jgi:hypothetical protein